MLIGERVRGGPETLRAAGPAGIIAFERLLPPPIPRLRPYVWSQEKAEQPAGKETLAQGALASASELAGPWCCPDGEAVGKAQYCLSAFNAHPIGTTVSRRSAVPRSPLSLRSSYHHIFRCMLDSAVR